MKKSFGHLLELAITYIVIFFILREWLVPVMQLTNTGLIHLFLVFIGVSLALSLFEVHPLFSGVIKLCYIIWFILFVYSSHPIFSIETISFLWNELQRNLIAIFTGKFGDVSDTFRTVLFFVLIWMLMYLIHYWITVRMNIFYFFVLTVFFIATLDTFSEYDGSKAIVKVVVLGLMMNGVLFVKRLWTQTSTTSAFFNRWKIVTPMLIAVVIASVSAFYLPKAEPIWADPVPYIQNIAEKGEMGVGSKTVGYGEDDSQLGGPFEGDSTLVFIAASRDRQYWRIETKDTYTSKGWIQSNDGNTSIESYANHEVIPTSLEVGNLENERQVDMNISLPMPFLIQTYGMKSVNSNDETEYWINVQTEKIMTKQYNGEDKKLLGYSVTYSKPSYSLQQLKISEVSMLETLDSSLTRFLQLPPSLPDRVQQLAVDLTKNKTTVYEQIKEIEGYFSRNGFQYDKKNVAIPTAEQDYVDQFLFDTKVGYCDNFSTSMVVMLRSIGIPARWVKGFAPGNAGSQSDGKREYRVTNDDAHSWVEAYVPGTGWMEFEPTIGFTGTTTINNDVDATKKSEEEALQQQEEKAQQQQQEQPKKEQRQTSQAVNSAFNLTTFLIWLKNHIYLWVSMIVAIAVTLVILFVQRKKWLPKMHVRLYRKKEADWANFDTSYQILIKQLSRIGLMRNSGETLHAFAERVDEALGTEEMRELTTVYEQHIYSKQPQEVDLVKLKESWEYLINRTIG